MQSDEDIGDIYQDEENQAAILLRNLNDTVIVVSRVENLGLYDVLRKSK